MRRAGRQGPTVVVRPTGRPDPVNGDGDVNASNANPAPAPALDPAPQPRLTGKAPPPSPPLSAQTTATGPSRAEPAA